MAKKIKVKDIKELEKLINDKNLDISKGIVEGILKNLIGKKKNVHVLEIYITEDDSIVDITCHRSDFIETLEENLKTHIYHEDYEACAGIKLAIDYLKK
tara:strand:- start:1315 stop:1611 length:297 start_codon:yes stop_codon:yes gene_type:complete